MQNLLVAIIFHSCNIVKYWSTLGFSYFFCKDNITVETNITQPVWTGDNGIIHKHIWGKSLKDGSWSLTSMSLKSEPWGDHSKLISDKIYGHWLDSAVFCWLNMMWTTEKIRLSLGISLALIEESHDSLYLGLFYDRGIRLSHVFACQ